MHAVTRRVISKNSMYFKTRLRMHCILSSRLWSCVCYLWICWADVDYSAVRYSANVTIWRHYRYRETE
ncbi:hypothetical protein HYPSUDRAFT_416642 [Hypholoma sublateritium FD-334 SS-4]|uniref:Uncharacterized protein n=1 Tax=Hypholoma sublateritium (strain FD-334 SS-4) TaxID=945553 RepID=A0A0D2N6R7_HYPSF|nr:hypothetical protein HYPSUDRAFT_416642 [Hypholoma sublateritium FD-334 SS-4]